VNKNNQTDTTVRNYLNDYCQPLIYVAWHIERERASAWSIWPYHLTNMACMAAAKKGAYGAESFHNIFFLFEQ
jgi:hypothetical protein